MKALITYFSCSGVTAKVAKTIAEVVQGDLFEIKPEIPYTVADLNWKDKNSRSSIEMKDKSSRPAIVSKVENINQYDVIFVGFPIWWYVAPTIINTFLESYDFKGKTIIPFATSGGSGAGKTDKYLKQSCLEDVRWLSTKVLNDYQTKEKINNWLNSLVL